MKLLLHICCAPCLIYPLERLKEQGFKLEGYFYNPNIHPFNEYKNRKQAIENLVRDGSEIALSRDGSQTKIGSLLTNESRTIPEIEIVYPEYNPKDFFQAINYMEEKLERCPVCWYLRLKKTAKLAKERGFDFFSTTLLVSPYQDQEAINRIGFDIAKEEGLKFIYEDFRPGFRKAHNLAKAKGLYCQKYCGCIYSEIEKCRESVKS